MPKCPYCESVIALEELEVQGVKVKKKIPSLMPIRLLTAILCPQCDSILNVGLIHR